MNHLNATLSVSVVLATTTIPSALLNTEEVASRDGEDEAVLLMPEWGFTLAAIVLFFIGFFGFFLNLIVIVLMCKDVQVSVPLPPPPFISRPIPNRRLISISSGRR